MDGRSAAEGGITLMDLAAYETENRIESSHWWYIGRRWLFLREIKRLGIAKEATILDIGTSTGTNLRMLRDAGFTNVRGVDTSSVAAKFCEQKGLGLVEIADICALPFPDCSIDFILATDIIEHVDDDIKAVSEIMRVLRHSAYALFTVPAFPKLWSSHDTFNHHKRRYYIEDLTRIIRFTGLELICNYYFNYILFIPIKLARGLISRLPKKRERSELSINTPLINFVLKSIFYLDIITARKLNPAFGLSALCIAQKPIPVGNSGL